MRINKLFSNYGICSRKEANRIIEQGRVYVNGEMCIKGQWVEEEDDIILDGEKIKKAEKVYLAFNKPMGITCTSNNQVKDNIIEFLNYDQYIFPIGRLDKESRGLILLTNDGDLSNMVINSNNKQEKEYIVKVDRNFNDEFVEKMSQGVEIFGVKTRPCKVKRIDEKTYNIVLSQGLNRQIRKMSLAFGYRVVDLKRVRVVNVELGDLKEGEIRHLTKSELSNLKNQIGFDTCGE